MSFKQPVNNDTRFAPCILNVLITFAVHGKQQHTMKTNYSSSLLIIKNHITHSARGKNGPLNGAVFHVASTNKQKN
jgi:hypothetical protein